MSCAKYLKIAAKIQLESVCCRLLTSVGLLRLGKSRDAVIAGRNRVGLSLRNRPRSRAVTDVTANQQILLQRRIDCICVTGVLN
jgi:hypothetical protein